MKNFKKLVSAVLSIFITFSTVNASSEPVNSNPNFCYKVENGKVIVNAQFRNGRIQIVKK